jgi:hypothetical protein
VAGVEDAGQVGRDRERHRSGRVHRRGHMVGATRANGLARGRELARSGRSSATAQTVAGRLRLTHVFAVDQRGGEEHDHDCN